MKTPFRVLVSIAGIASFIGCSQETRLSQVRHSLDRVDVEAVRIWAIDILKDESVKDWNEVSIGELPGAKELGVYQAYVFRGNQDVGPHLVLYVIGHYRAIISIGDKGFKLPARNTGLRVEYTDGIWIDISSN